MIIKSGSKFVLVILLDAAVCCSDTSITERQTQLSCKPLRVATRITEKLITPDTDLADT